MNNIRTGGIILKFLLFSRSFWLTEPVRVPATFTLVTYHHSHKGSNLMPSYLVDTKALLMFRYLSFSATDRMNFDVSSSTWYLGSSLSSLAQQRRYENRTKTGINIFFLIMKLPLFYKLCRKFTNLECINYSEN